MKMDIFKKRICVCVCAIFVSAEKCRRGCQVARAGVQSSHKLPTVGAGNQTSVLESPTCLTPELSLQPLKSLCFYFIVFFLCLSV